MNLFDRIPQGLFGALTGRNNRRAWDLLVRLFDRYFGPDSVPPYPDGYGNIIGIADSTRFHLRSAHQILATLFPAQPDFPKGLDEILQRLEFGLPSSALALTKVSARLTRGQRLELLSVGVRNEEDLKTLNDDRLRLCVGPGTAALLRPTIAETSGAK